MKRITTLIVILIVILVVAGFAYYSMSTPVVAPVVETATSTTATTTSNQPVSTAGWSVYQSKTYSLMYPSDFKQQTTAGVTRLIVPIKSYFNTVLPTEVYFTLNDASTTCPEIAGDSVVGTTTLTTGATIFTKEEWSGVGAGQLYIGTDYITKKDGLCYDVSLFTHSANGAGFYFTDPAQIQKTDAQHSADMQKFFNLGDTIMSTFQFNSVVKINI